MASATIGALRVVLGMNAGQFTQGVQQAAGAMNRLATRAAAMGAAIGGAFALNRVRMFTAAMIEKLGKQEDALAAVEAAVKATGGTAGFTTSQLAKMAAELQKISTFGDEEILKNLTANMLTFTSIVGPVFKEAQIQAMNLSARLGQDLRSSAVQLGKALNDPVLGLTALRRVGVAFTEVQKDQIKQFVKAGDIMSAQKVILKELGHEFDNQATAISRTTQGQVTQAANAWGDAMEKMGASTSPLIVSVANTIKSISEGFQELTPTMQRFITVSGLVTTVVAGVAAAAGALAAIFGGPVVLAAAAVAAAIGVVAGAVAAFWPEVRAAATMVGNAFADMYNAAKTWIMDRLGPIIDWVSEKLKALSGFIGSLDLNPFKGTTARITEEGKQMIAAVMKTHADLMAAQKTGAEEAVAAAPALSESMAIANVQAAAKAAAAAQTHKEAGSAISAEQNRMVMEGVRLAKQARSPAEVMADSQNRLNAALEAGKISAAQYGAAMAKASAVAQNAYAGMASDIANSLTQVFGKSKAVAIAAALINSYEAATRALATYPPPWSYAAAAASLAAGLAQVANIRKTTQQSTGGGGGGSVSSAGAGVTQVPQTLMVEGISPGQLFSGEAVKSLAGKLLDYQRDGGRVVLV